MNLQLVGQVMQWVQREIQFSLGVFRDKGAGRFTRALGLGFVALYAAYAGIYAPPVGKLLTLQKRIDAAKATAKYADEYRSIRERLNQVQADLPPQRERNIWLTNLVIESMKAEGIVAETIPSPGESELSGYYFQKVGLSLSLRFPQLVSWLNRLENNKPLIRIQTLDVSKGGTPEVGVNRVSLEISTLIPGRASGS